ncbi:hypothetical protein FRC03_001683 [Tulasnella sp. 419]|nr:hypothetical protein FRC03_001683 [Tulasnella sp. 419]
MISPSYAAAVVLWSILVFGVFTKTLMNTSIDDTSPSFAYLPPEAWLDKTCVPCWAVPDTSLVYGGGWRVSTAYTTFPTMSAVLTFRGVAVFVYSVAWDGTDEKPSRHVNLVFSLDGVSSPAYKYTRITIFKPVATYEYDLLVFSATGLTDTQHSLVITLMPDSVFLLDRAVVMQETGESASRKSNSSLAIAGGILGGTAGLLLIFGFLWVWLSRRQSSRSQEPISSLPSADEEKLSSPVQTSLTSGVSNNQQVFEFLIKNILYKLPAVQISSQWVTTLSNQHLILTNSRSSRFGTSMVSEAIIIDIPTKNIRKHSFTSKGSKHHVIAHLLSPNGSILVRWQKIGPNTKDCIIEAIDTEATRLIHQLTSQGSCDIADIRACRWANNNTLYLPNSDDKTIIRWSLVPDAPYSITIQPDQAISNHEVLRFHITADEKWWVANGRSHGSQGGGTGLIQIHGVERDKSELVAGVTCCITEVDVYDVKKALLVVADTNAEMLVLRVDQLDPNASGEAFNPVETSMALSDPGDCPQSVVVFQHIPIVAIITTKNVLYFFELHFGSFLFSQRLDSSEECLGSTDAQSLLVHARQKGCM